MESELPFLRGINDGSPAFNFYRSHGSVFKNLSITFSDPFESSGGFGASSAQFVLLYKAYLKLAYKQFNISQFINEYRKLACDENDSSKPSGADCVAQYYNHHVFFNSANNSVEKVEWNFLDIDFLIFKTGTKVPTHQHLKDLQKIDTSELDRCVRNVKHSLTTKNKSSLAKNVMDFFYILKDKNLVLQQSADLVEELMKTRGVFAAKGCGAMSADTIIVIFEKEQRHNVLEVARNLKLEGLPNQLFEPLTLSNE
jgi:mevalonate kinase